MGLSGYPIIDDITDQRIFAGACLPSAESAELKDYWEFFG
jgi:hypothetical protein